MFVSIFSHSLSFYNFLTLSLSPSFTHLCDVDQVRDRSLDTVASAFDLGFDQRHLVPVERVFNRPIDVDFFRHDDVLQIVLGGGRGSGSCKQACNGVVGNGGGGGGGGGGVIACVLDLVLLLLAKSKNGVAAGLRTKKKIGRKGWREQVSVSQCAAAEGWQARLPYMNFIYQHVCRNCTSVCKSTVL